MRAHYQPYSSRRPHFAIVVGIGLFATTADMQLAGPALAAEQGAHPRYAVGRFSGIHRVLNVRSWGGVVRLGQTTVVTAAISTTVIWTSRGCPGTCF